MVAQGNAKQGSGRNLPFYSHLLCATERRHVTFTALTIGGTLIELMVDFKTFNMANPTYTVLNNENKMQFETDFEGNKAYLTYVYHKNEIAFVHTSVPDELKGRGIAGALVRYAFAFAEQLKKPVISYCPFVAGFIKTHPEYNKQLDPEFYKEGLF